MNTSILSVKPASLRRFDAALRGMSKELGRSAPAVLKHGSILFCKSMRARTKKAPKLRPTRVVYVGGKAKNGREMNHLGTMYWEVKSFKGGQEKWHKVLAYGKDTLKKNVITRILYSGLAKKSWGWIMKDLFNSNEGAPVGFKRPNGATNARKGSNGSKSFVHFQSRIGYINSAIRGGRAGVSEAFDKAGKAIRWRTEEELIKRGVKKR